IGQRKIVPALDLMRLDDGARRIVHRSAEADADAAQLAAVVFGLDEQLGNGLDDLPANAVGALRGVERAAPQPGERPLPAPQAELQFRAADSNTEKHDDYYFVRHCSAASHDSNSARDNDIYARLEFSWIHPCLNNWRSSHETLAARARARPVWLRRRFKCW